MTTMAVSIYTQDAILVLNIFSHNFTIQLNSIIHIAHVASPMNLRPQLIHCRTQYKAFQANITLCRVPIYNKANWQDFANYLKKQEIK